MINKVIHQSVDNAMKIKDIDCLEIRRHTRDPTPREYYRTLKDQKCLTQASGSSQTVAGHPADMLRLLCRSINWWARTCDVNPCLLMKECVTLFKVVEPALASVITAQMPRFNDEG
jgi:hypothetical protein